MLWATALTAGGQPRSATFGTDWVKSNPFTIGALAQNPTLVDATEYKGGGFSNFLAWKRPSELLPIAVDARLPWHFHISDVTLTQSVKDEVTTSYANYRGNTGWLVHDETRRVDMASVGQIASWIKLQTPGSLVYTNVLPMGGDAAEYYGNSSNPNYGYTDYLNDTMSIIKPDVLMFDMYPFGLGDMGESAFWYANLMSVRSVAKANNVPYWAFIQAYEQTDKPDKRLSSESDLRFQIFSAMTAGYTGFHYFAYDSVGTRAVLDHSGNPTLLYAVAQQVNADAMVIGRTMRLLKSTAVYFIPNGNTVPGGITAYTPRAGDSLINHVDVDTNPSFGNSTGPWKTGVIGFFTDDDGEKYFMITNGYHGDALSSADTTLHFEIRLDASIDHVLWMNPDTGLAQVVLPDFANVLRLTIGGGDAMLFKYDTGKGFAVPEPGSATLIIIAGAALLHRRRAGRAFDGASSFH